MSQARDDPSPIYLTVAMDPWISKEISVWESFENSWQFNETGLNPWHS